MGAELKSNTAQVKSDLDFKIQLMTRLILEDIHRRSTPKTPMSVKGGTLRAMVAKQMQGKTGIIEWRAPYAEYQERGYTSGPVRHYTTPGTQAHFAEESVQEVMNNLPEYITKAGIV